MVALITGSAGLIGSEAVRFVSKKGMDVVGIDNDMRAYFFGPEASTQWRRTQLQKEIPHYRHENIDIRDYTAMKTIFQKLGSSIQLILHTAAQPSHDWAAQEPLTDPFFHESNELYDRVVQGLLSVTSDIPVVLNHLWHP